MGVLAIAFAMIISWAESSNKKLARSAKPMDIVRRAFSDRATSISIR